MPSVIVIMCLPAQIVLSFISPILNGSFTVGFSLVCEVNKSNVAK